MSMYYMATAAAALGTAGYAYEKLARYRDNKAYLPPGELVDAEGNPTGKKSPVGAVFLGEDSPLTADVKAGGENKFDFEVGTKAAASGG